MFSVLVGGVVGLIAVWPDPKAWMYFFAVGKDVRSLACVPNHPLLGPKPSLTPKVPKGSQPLSRSCPTWTELRVSSPLSWTSIGLVPVFQGHLVEDAVDGLLGVIVVYHALVAWVTRFAKPEPCQIKNCETETELTAAINT